MKVSRYIRLGLRALYLRARLAYLRSGWHLRRKRKRYEADPEIVADAERKRDAIVSRLWEAR